MIGAGSKGAVVTLVEHKTGYAGAEQGSGGRHEGVKSSFERGLTGAFDNGKAFAGHQTVAQRLKADGFFADPYGCLAARLQRKPERAPPARRPKGGRLREDYSCCAEVIRSQGPSTSLTHCWHRSIQMRLPSPKIES